MNSKDSASTPISTAATLDEGLVRITEARHHDPFEVLGRHIEQNEDVFRVFLPQAETARIGGEGPELSRIAGTDLFEARTRSGNAIPPHYAIHWMDKKGETHSHVATAFLPRAPCSAL